MAANNATGKKTYAQVAASPPQSEDGNGSETGEILMSQQKNETVGHDKSNYAGQNTTTHGVNLAKLGTQSGSTDSSIGSEPELIHTPPLDNNKSADDGGKSVGGQRPKVPVDNAAEEFIPRMRTSMLTDKEKEANKKDEQSEDELEVINEEMEKKRLRRRKAVAIIGGVIVGLAIVGAIWWTVRRRSSGG